MFGGSPKESSQPQNIFVAVASCTWISRPMTASSSPERLAPTPVADSPLGAALDTGGYSIESDRQLERVGGVQQAALAERGARHLKADR